MKKPLIALGLITIALILMVAPVSAAKPGPNIEITLLNPPPEGVLVLAVGQSHTFDIRITSDQPFVSAITKVDIYYPGKGVYWHAGSDIVSQGTTALLHLTVVGKKSTAGLMAVCDWPFPGICWPAGVAPQTIHAGARFQGGLVSGTAFPFAISVP